MRASVIQFNNLNFLQAGFQYDIVLMNEVELVGLRNDHNTGRGDSHKFMEYIALPQISNTLAGYVCTIYKMQLYNQISSI